MSVQEVSPGRFVVQRFAADPMGGRPRRWCKRVQGRSEAEEQDKAFQAEATEWVARQRLIKQASAKGIALALPSTQPSELGFASFLAQTYLPWAQTHLDPNTMRARTPTLTILSQDLAGTPLHQIDTKIDELVTKWRNEGCRYSAKTDRLGRPTNHKPRAISDAGINERLKVLRAILGHAHMQARVLAVAPRIPLLKKKRANPGSAAPIRYFTPDERVRFLTYARPDVRDIFEVGRMLGVRPGELFHLKVGSIDFRERKVWIRATSCPLCKDGVWVPKTGCYRGVDICPSLLPILRRLTSGRHDDDLLFENTHGAPYSRLVGSGGQFTKTLRRAGLDRQGLSMYSLRHTFAADLITAGRPIQEVAALLGNTPRTCELHYAHLMPGKTREAVQVLSAIDPWAPFKVTSSTDERRSPELGPTVEAA